MTPYGRDGGCSCESATDYATSGFVLAVVDVRGTGGSQGNLDQNYFSPREAKDGYDTVEFLGTQPWSNGKVGMSGGSYLGITQYLTAEQDPPHLAAIVPDEALADVYNDAAYPGGILSLSFDAQYLAVQGDRAVVPVGHLACPQQGSAAPPGACPGTRTCLNRAARAARPEQTGPTTMSTQRSHHRSRHWMATRQAGARLGRLATGPGRGHHRPAAGLGRRHGRVREPDPDRGRQQRPHHAGRARHRPRDQRRRHGGLAGRPDRGRAALAAAAPAASADRKLACRRAPPLPPPDAPTRNRTPRLSDDRPPGLDRQAGLHLPSSRSGKS